MNKPTSEWEQKWEKMRKRVVIHVHFVIMSSAYGILLPFLQRYITNFPFVFIPFADTLNILGEKDHFSVKTNSTLFRQHFIWWKLKKTISYDKLFILVVATWLAQLYYMWVSVAPLPFSVIFSSLELFLWFFFVRTSSFFGVFAWIRNNTHQQSITLFHLPPVLSLQIGRLFFSICSLMVLVFLNQNSTKAILLRFQFQLTVYKLIYIPRNISNLPKADL